MEFFHVFNRGVERRDIFVVDQDYNRFLQTALLVRLSKAPKVSVFLRQKKLGMLQQVELEALYGPPLVEIVAFCLMPNHYHFLLKSESRAGVSKFMQRVGDAHTKYFNTRHNRDSRLFGGQYKFVRIESDEQLVQVSRYIHLNPHMSSRTNVPLNNLSGYPWSSLQDYISNKRSDLCNPQEVLSFFSSGNDYWDFVKAGVSEQEEVIEQYPKDIFIDLE